MSDCPIRRASRLSPSRLSSSRLSPSRLCVPGLQKRMDQASPARGLFSSAFGSCVLSSSPQPWSTFKRSRFQLTRMFGELDQSGLRCSFIVIPAWPASRIFPHSRSSFRTAASRLCSSASNKFSRTSLHELFSLLPLGPPAGSSISGLGLDCVGRYRWRGLSSGRSIGGRMRHSPIRGETRDGR